MTSEREYHELYLQKPWLFPRPPAVPEDVNYEQRYWDAYDFAKEHEIRWPHLFATTATTATFKTGEAWR